VCSRELGRDKETRSACPPSPFPHLLRHQAGDTAHDGDINLAETQALTQSTAGGVLALHQGRSEQRITQSDDLQCTGTLW
jgi:hypothetical protein